LACKVPGKGGQVEQLGSCSSDACSCQATRHQSARVPNAKSRRLASSAGTALRSPSTAWQRCRIRSRAYGECIDGSRGGGGTRQRAVVVPKPQRRASTLVGTAPTPPYRAIQANGAKRT